MFKEPPFYMLHSPWNISCQKLKEELRNFFCISIFILFLNVLIMKNLKKNSTKIFIIVITIDII